MARYEFRCRECGDTFQVSRPMSQASEPAPCPEGHGDTVKLLSTFASVTGAPGGGEPAMAPAAPCGAHCACHPG